MLHSASRRLVVAPRPPHTAALWGDGERTGSDDHLGEQGALRGSPGDASLAPRDGGESKKMEIPTHVLLYIPELA